MHEGEGRWVDSNKLVELKRKKKVYKQTLERVWKKVNALALLVGM